MDYFLMTDTELQHALSEIGNQMQQIIAPVPLSPEHSPAGISQEQGKKLLELAEKKSLIEAIRQKRKKA